MLCIVRIVLCYRLVCDNIFNMARFICNGRHLPYNPDLKILSQKLRNNATSQENKLWYQFLRLQKVHFYRQKPLDRFIVDFYCPKFKLVIELDGGHHFSEYHQKYDEERTEVLGNYGLKVLRFTNHQIDFEFDFVCRQITGYLNSSLIN